MNIPYRWVIVAAGGLLGCVAIGSMFSLPVFLAPIALATGWSRTGLAIGSCGMSLGAVAIMLTFRPAIRPNRGDFVLAA